jgi:hypothetical protein
MKPKKPDGNGDVPQHALNRARTDETLSFYPLEELNRMNATEVARRYHDGMPKHLSAALLKMGYFVIPIPTLELAERRSLIL